MQTPWPVYAEVRSAFHIDMLKLTYLDHWYVALRSPAGYCFRVTTGDVTTYLNKLYKSRADAMDPQLKTLSLVRSPTDEREVWIVHREAAEHGPEADTTRSEEGDDEFPQDQL